MMSCRGPRPTGIIASIALIPVCSGSCTLLRCITPGACSSSARRTVAVIAPRASIGVGKRMKEKKEVCIVQWQGQHLPRASDRHALFDAAELTENNNTNLVLVKV